MSVQCTACTNSMSDNMQYSVVQKDGRSEGGPHGLYFSLGLADRDKHDVESRSLSSSLSSSCRGVVVVVRFESGTLGRLENVSH